MAPRSKATRKRGLAPEGYDASPLLAQSAQRLPKRNRPAGPAHFLGEADLADGPI
jgi:hypothetical protein